MKAMFEVIKYEGDNSTLVYRYPTEDFNTKSQLIVQQSQEAVFYSRGRLADCFTEGSYTLTTKNIPILRGLVNLPFGAESPFSAVIYFVNKTEQMNIKWGIQRVGFLEPTYGAALQVGACGILSFKVEDARIFLAKLVGQKPTFDQEEVMTFLREFINSHGRAHLADIFNNDASIDIVVVEKILNELSDKLKEKIAVDFSEYGLKLEKFIVSSIQKDEESPAYQALLQQKQQALDLKAIELEGQRRQAQQNVELGLHVQQTSVEQDLARRGVEVGAEAQKKRRELERITSVQEHAFVVAEKTAQNEGVGNFASAGMGIGIGIGAAGAAAGAVGGMYNDALSAVRSDSSSATSSEKESASSVDFSGCGLDDADAPAGGASAENSESKRSKRDRLTELKELLEDDLISEDEFKARKAEILSEI